MDLEGPPVQDKARPARPAAGKHKGKPTLGPFACSSFIETLFCELDVVCGCINKPLLIVGFVWPVLDAEDTRKCVAGFTQLLWETALGTPNCGKKLWKAASRAAEPSTSVSMSAGCDVILCSLKSISLTSLSSRLSFQKGS
jgi:hypothetical protein